LKFFNLKIRSVQKITNDTVEITFIIPAQHAQNFRFLPGQYVTIAPVINGQSHRRAYSICSSTEQENLSILVKEIKDGKVSSYVNSQLKAGVEMLVRKSDCSDWGWQWYNAFDLNYSDCTKKH